jgi:ElaB/YqjD/DUF883 family membrane-anchored ribosome-binding protein
VDNQVTDGRKPEEKKPEEIEREMEHTRESITQKVAALEQTVTGKVQSVTDTVEQVKHSIQDTVASVKDTVQDTVCSVKDSLRESVHAVADTVKETFDISGHVRSYPWVSVGVAAGAGFLTGLLLGGRRYSLGATAKMPEEQARGGLPGEAVRTAYTPPQPREPEKPGMFDELFGMVSREFKQVAEMALNSAITAVKRNVNEAVPHLVDTAVAQVVPNGHGTAAGNGADRPGYAARG